MNALLVLVFDTCRIVIEVSLLLWLECCLIEFMTFDQVLQFCDLLDELKGSFWTNLCFWDINVVLAESRVILRLRSKRFLESILQYLAGKQGNSVAGL